MAEVQPCFHYSRETDLVHPILGPLWFRKTMKKIQLLWQLPCCFPVLIYLFLSYLAILWCF